ncbi:hypothetical protein DIJ64_07825 [Mycobacterium leprae]|uniref:Uncharacterized protein n=1 Tax=Mycobacterium leprae TaxID=1769 RepID=A0AAD0P8R2_MYCLR|nr:hypothetical protein DIJ64_07825 [Mycobacterium leprae]OAR19793.1 hypothetical protein A8144_03860 [Mycobacterium leprae 3125609]OAX71907.1 hypothetical protein A3216_02900 [Mycobacterium leprae 7935681]
MVGARVAVLAAAAGRIHRPFSILILSKELAQQTKSPAINLISDYQQRLHVTTTADPSTNASLA